MERARRGEPGAASGPGRGSREAIILFSGGLDSTTLARVAQEMGFGLHGLTFRYGQRHAREVEGAGALSRELGFLSHRVVGIDESLLKGSALTDRAIPVPRGRETARIADGPIPATYVPARNTVFLSMALALSEVLGVEDIFIGVNALDYSGYPDCRPEYLRAFEAMARLATRAAVEGGDGVRIHAPLIDLDKAQIIRRGLELGVDYSRTWSCYDPTPQGLPCGACDSCLLRRKGFREVGVADPAPGSR